MGGTIDGMRVSAKADYAVRACAELAASPHGDPVRADDLAAGQQLPVAFLERILGDLRRGGVVTSVRGRSGGYRLARSADEITLADVIRAVDGPLVTVRDERDRKSTRLNSSHVRLSRMPSSA